MLFSGDLWVFLGGGRIVVRGFFTRRWDPDKDLKMDNFAFKKILQRQVSISTWCTGSESNQINYLYYHCTSSTN